MKNLHNRWLFVGPFKNRDQQARFPTMRISATPKAISVNHRMNSDTSKLSLLIWSGPIGIALVAIGFFGLAGFLPPPSPLLLGADVTSFWSNEVELKKTGLMLCIWGGVLYVPFTIAIGFVLRHAETTPIMSIVQAALGTFGTVFFSLNFYLLLMAPYRLGGSEASLQILHDLGFSMTFSPVQPFTFQYIAIALGILYDKSATPVFPRWVGYTNLWVAVLFIPACLIPFVKTGPLAWNGLLSFWIPVAVFMIWYVVMFWAMRRHHHLLVEIAETAPAPTHVTHTSMT